MNVDFKAVYLVYASQPQFLAIGKDALYHWSQTLLHERINWKVTGGLDRAQMMERYAKLFPNARAYYELFEKALGEIDAPLGLALLVVALMPAIAEEACFRGVVLSGFSNTGSRRVALVASAVLFGLFHLNPYHAIGAGALGLAFGWAAIESGSLLPGSLAHLVNNGLAMVMLRHPAFGARMDRAPVFVAGLLFTAAGLWLLRGTRASRATTS